MDAAVVQSTVREIQDVVREASQHTPPTDFVEIDRVSFSLKLKTPHGRDRRADCSGSWPTQGNTG